MSNPGMGLLDTVNDGLASKGFILSTAVIIGEHALRLLQTAGDFGPVPGIAVAAGIALSIINIAQTVKANKEEFISIGRDSCLIMVTVIQRVNVSQSEQIASVGLAVLQQDANQLVEDMQAIEACVKKHVKKRSLMKRILHHQVDQETILECRSRLQHAISLFGLQSDIEVRKQLATLSTQLAELLEQQKTSQPPLQMPQPEVPQPQASAMQPPKSARSQARAERRRLRDEARQSQLMNVAMGDPAGFPASGTNSFANVQNHIAPGANISYSYVGGDMNHTVRDDSFNVSGSGNNINFSFAR